MIKRKKRRVQASVTTVLILVALILAGASSYMIDYSLGYPQQERNSAEHWQDRMKDECPWTIPWMDSIYQKHCVRDTFVTMSSGYRAHAIYLYAHGESEGDHIQMGGTTVGMCCDGRKWLMV